ncbi:MAG: hypothetical protein ACTSYB_13795 [Candidatus Helarchaeota archaeon]
MEHFLTKIIRNTVGQNDPDVHRRFVKFSKGSFPNGGPVLKVKATKKKNLTINGSFEYEDLIGYFVATHLPEDFYKIEGTIYTQPRVSLESIQKDLNELGLQDGWVQGKRELKNLFMLPMNLVLTPHDIVQIYDKLAENCFLLLTITPSKGGKEWALKTDKKIPPLKKTFGKAEPYTTCKPETKIKCKVAELCKTTGICIKERTNFCRTKTSQLSDDEIKHFMELFLPDFPNLGSSFTDLLLINKYTITEFEMPEDKDSLSPRELREKIKRKGYLERIVYMDKELYSNKVEFIV